MTGREPDRVEAARARRRSRVLTAVAVAVGIAALLVAGQPEPATPGGSTAAAPDPSAAAAALPAPTTPVPTTADPLAAPADAPAGARPSPTPTPTPTPDPLDVAAARARAVTAGVDWASFTLLDRTAGRGVGDRRAAEPTNTESTVKAWLAGDLLRRRGGTLVGYERTLVDRMVRVSDDNAAQVVWRMLGADRSIERMIRTCGMTDTTVYPGRWALTQISSRDLARLGACLAPGPGRLLSGKAGAELLRLMRTVEPSNAFGIQQAQPAGPGVRIAVKNGWTEHGGTGLWNVNCLAMWGENLRWVLAVTMRYPIPRGLAYGAGVCRRVTTALFP